MATVSRRGTRWSAQVRRKGFPSQSKTFTTKAAALAWARDREAWIDRTIQAPRVILTSVTLKDLLVRYRDTVAPGLRGADALIARLNKMIRASVCSLSLDDLTASAFAAYRDHRLNEAKPSTVKLELSLFSRILTIADREWDIELPGNPIRKIALPSFSNARNRRLEAGEHERLMTALKRTRNPIVKPVVLFAIATAMRRGEILGLQWKDIDLAQRTAFIPQAKNGHARHVPLSDDAIAVLLSRPDRNGTVFPITAIALRLAWDRLITRAKIAGLRFHDLRHEAISRYAEMDLSTAELQIMSGHRDIRMLSRYTHLRPSDVAKKLAGRSWQ